MLSKEHLRVRRRWMNVDRIDVRAVVELALEDLENPPTVLLKQARVFAVFGNLGDRVFLDLLVMDVIVDLLLDDEKDGFHGDRRQSVISERPDLSQEMIRLMRVARDHEISAAIDRDVCGERVSNLTIDVKDGAIVLVLDRVRRVNDR